MGIHYYPIAWRSQVVANAIMSRSCISFLPFHGTKATGLIGLGTPTYHRRAIFGISECMSNQTPTRDSPRLYIIVTQPLYES